MKKIISAMLILTMLLSIVCVSASADTTYINMNFESMATFQAQFTAGEFFVEENDQLLFGYSAAKALQSLYHEENGIFDNTLNTWLTYDASIEICIADDEETDGDRYVNLVYCNDNLLNQGLAEERVQMAFIYDVQNACFRLAEGWNTTEEESQYMAPVEMEIDTEGEDFFTMGISVTTDNIRCFYNDQLIFDFRSPDYLIAKEINSPFLFWQDGNFIQVKNITVKSHGGIYPYTAPVVSDTQGVGTSAEPFVSGDDPNVSTNEGPAPGTDASGNPDPNVPSAGGNGGASGGNGGNSGNNGGNGGNSGNNGGAVAATTTSQKIVEVTDAEGNTVTDAEGNAVTSISIVTNPNVPAATNANRPAGGNSTDTGDSAFVVIAAMVACLGTAIVVKKVNVK